MVVVVCRWLLFGGVRQLRFDYFCCFQILPKVRYLFCQKNFIHYVKKEKLILKINKIHLQLRRQKYGLQPSFFYFFGIWLKRPWKNALQQNKAQMETQKVVSFPTSPFLSFFPSATPFLLPPPPPPLPRSLSHTLFLSHSLVLYLSLFSLPTHSISFFLPENLLHS